MIKISRKEINSLLNSRWSKEHFYPIFFISMFLLIIGIVLAELVNVLVATLAILVISVPLCWYGDIKQRNYRRDILKDGYAILLSDD